MSSQKQTIINPKTGRPIMVGGRVWTLLLREGLINNDNYRDEHILYEIEQELPQEPLPLVRSESAIQELAQSETDNVILSQLPNHQQAVKGRGKYKGKMVRRNKQLKPEQVHKQVADCAVRAVKKYTQSGHSSHFTDENDEDLNNLIQKMIMDEMITNNEADEEFVISSDVDE